MSAADTYTLTMLKGSSTAAISTSPDAAARNVPARSGLVLKESIDRYGSMDPGQAARLASYQVRAACGSSSRR